MSRRYNKEIYFRSKVPGAAMLDFRPQRAHTPPTMEVDPGPSNGDLAGTSTTHIGWLKKHSKSSPKFVHMGLAPENAVSCTPCRQNMERCSSGDPCSTCTLRRRECFLDPDFDSDTLILGGKVTTWMTPQSSSAGGGDQDDPPFKSIRTTSRGGLRPRVAAQTYSTCNYCKEHRRKCTSERPKCTTCDKRGIPCIYEKKPPGRNNRSSNSASNNNKDSASVSSDANTPLRDMPDDNPRSKKKVKRSTRPESPTGNLHERFPGKGLGNAEPRDKASSKCDYCYDVELPCNSGLPSCINCTRRRLTCHYGSNRSSSTSTSNCKSPPAESKAKSSNSRSTSEGTKSSSNSGVSGGENTKDGQQLVIVLEGPNKPSDLRIKIANPKLGKTSS